MNVRFELQGGSDVVDIFPSPVAIGTEPYTPGAYVRLAITKAEGVAHDGYLVMTKGEARAIASAIMGVAAEL